MPTAKATDPSTPAMLGIAVPGVSDYWRRRLLFAFRLGVAALLVYYALYAKTTHPDHLYLGLAICVLAVVPTHQWIAAGVRTLPIFEVLMLTTLTNYALPLLNGHEAIYQYSPETISRSAVLIIAYLLAALTCHLALRVRISQAAFWRVPVASTRFARALVYGNALNTAYLLITLFASLVPGQFEGILRALFFGIGLICTFVTSLFLGQGLLRPGQRNFFLFNLAAQALLMATSLILINSISLLVLAFLGYVTGRGRVPLIAVLSLFALIAVLHNGKGEMRARYWESGRSVTLLGLPEFFTEWISAGLQSPRTVEEGNEGALTRKLLERTSLYQMLCLVVDWTPQRQPYLQGETYWDIPAQLVPRPLWPGKPSSQLAMKRLSIYYGLLSEEGAESTSIAFGMQAEAYANYGLLGVIILGCFFGAGLKVVQSLALGGPLLSYGGLLLIILLAWSFQVEVTLGVWLSSLAQSAVAVLGAPFVLRNFTN